MHTANYITGYRKCGTCGTKTNNLNISTCPKCGGFMYPISYGYMPKVQKKSKDWSSMNA